MKPLQPLARDLLRDKLRGRVRIVLPLALCTILWSSGAAASSAAPTPAAAPAASSALPEVTNAWARATVPGQASGGVFMRLVSPVDLKLVGVSSPAARLAQVHEMADRNGVMVMRAVPSLDLPSKRPVELKPGGLHVMLFELKQPLAAGAHFPLTLVFSDGHTERSETVDVVVRPLSAS